MEPRERHLKLLTETIEAVNSTLDLQEVLVLVATKVADALEADAVLRLPLRRARGRARAARDARDADRRDVAPAADEARRGDHRVGCGGPCSGDAGVTGAP